MPPGDSQLASPSPSGAWAGIAAGGCILGTPPPLEDVARMLPQYEVLEFIGQGGMGAVYKARQKSLNRVVAVKVLPPQAPRPGELDFAARFKVEAQAMARLSHPNIVAVHDFGTSEDGQLFYIMECVEGTDLAELLEVEGKLPPDEALRIATAVCQALECAHAQGVVHRDIKPSNILLGRDGSVKVADFGLAKMDDPTSITLTLSGTSMGSQGYAAPEVFAKASSADHRADIYSLGVVLYEMLTGHVPRGMFKLPSEKVASLGTQFDEIICKALEEDREERHQSAAELKKELDEAGRASNGTVASPPSAATQIEKGEPAHRAPPAGATVRMQVAAGMAIILGLLLMVWLSIGWMRSEAPEQSATSAPPLVGEWQNVLAQIDLTKHRRAGTWKIIEGHLENTDAMQGGLVELPVSATGASDLRIKLTRLQPGSGKIIFAFHIGPHGGQFTVSDYAAPRAGLECIDEKGISNNGAHVEHVAAYLTIGHSHELLLRLREEGMTATLDGVELCRWKGDWTRVTQGGVWMPEALKDKNPFAIFCDNGRVRLEEIAFREVPGAEGKALPQEPVNVPRTPPLPEAQVFAGKGHRYQFVPGACMWSEAEANAKSMGGHLATLTTQEEHDWVWRTFSPWLPSQLATHHRGRGWWIGGLSTNTGGPWKWVTDEPFSYTCWSGDGAFPEARAPRIYQHDNGGGSGLSAWSTVHYSTRRPGFLVEWDTRAATASKANPQPLEKAAKTSPTDEEQRAFASWLFSLPPSAEPGHVGPNKVPDLSVENLSRNLRKVAELPAKSFGITRVRVGPLRLDDAARQQLAVLGRLPRLWDLRIYGAEDASALGCLRERTYLGTLIFMGSPETPPMKDEELTALARLTNLNSLRLERWRGFTGQGLSHLKEKRSLDTLGLNECPDVTDLGLQEVARFAYLKSLSLTVGAGVTDAGLTKLAKLLRLESLTLNFTGDTRATGSGLAALATLKHLRTLTLEGEFPGDAFAYVGRLSSLEELHCIHNSTVTDASVAGLAGLAKLHTLRVDDTRVTGTGFEGFKDFTSLSHLRVDDCYLSDRGFRAIAAAFPQLESLSISRNRQPYSLPIVIGELSRLPKLTRLLCGFNFKDADLGEVARLTALTGLNLRHSAVTDAGIPHLKPLVNLASLELAELPLTDACIPALVELRALKHLILTGTAITEAGVAELKRALPECRVTR